MEKKAIKDIPFENVSHALNHFSHKGKDTFHIAEWTEVMGGNRVRACKILADLRKDGQVARVADDTYLIMPSHQV